MEHQSAVRNGTWAVYFPQSKHFHEGVFRDRDHLAWHALKQVIILKDLCIVTLLQGFKRLFWFYNFECFHIFKVKEKTDNAAVTPIIFDLCFCHNRHPTHLTQSHTDFSFALHFY